ncbi:MAG: zinc-dependent alcohol dehydrogenase [Candidatus Geothermincolia bacterium]
MRALYFENSMARVGLLQARSLIDKNAAFGKLSPLRYGEIPEPQLPNERWLKVRNIACGLCGTDIHFIFMQINPMVYAAATPSVFRKFLGHELVGVVTEVGTEVAGLAPGDRVGMRMDWPSCRQMEFDPPCPQCARGDYMLCENWGARDLAKRDTGGGFSPYAVMHRSQPFKVPAALTNDEAVLLEPVSVAVHGVHRRMPQAGERVLVIGAGTIGLLTLAVARALAPQAEYWVVARYPFQAEMAKRLGAAGVVSEGKDDYRALARASRARYYSRLGNRILIGGFEVIYDSIGNDGTVHNALRWARGGGHVVVMGVNFKPGKIDYSPVWQQEVTLTGINSHATEADGRSSWEIAAELLESGRLDVSGIITHRFRLDQYRQAIETFVHKGAERATKIVIEYPG